MKNNHRNNAEVEIRQQAVAQIPWGGTIIKMMQMALSHNGMLWYINQRKGWGSKYIQRLSNDLKEYGKGYSTQNLYRMVQFASEFTEDEIFSQLGGRIPWTTIIEIIQKVKLCNKLLHKFHGEQL